MIIENQLSSDIGIQLESAILLGTSSFPGCACSAAGRNIYIIYNYGTHILELPMHLREY
jgi:hypothetical protein